MSCAEPDGAFTAEATCVGKELIDKATRDAVDAAAHIFVDMLAANEPRTAAPLDTQRAKSALSADKLAKMGLAVHVVPSRGVQHRHHRKGDFWGGGQQAELALRGTSQTSAMTAQGPSTRVLA